jgi:hypothetical protein
VASALSARSAFAILSYRSTGTRLAVRGQSMRSRDSR